MMLAILDLRFYANNSHRSTTYYARARAFLPDCGSRKDRITTSEKLVGGDDARHVLRVWQIFTTKAGLIYFTPITITSTVLIECDNDQDQSDRSFLCNLSQNYTLYIMCFTSVKRGRAHHKTSISNPGMI